MGSFGIDGLGLGGRIDVQGTVAQLLELEAGPIRLLQQQQGRLDAKSAAFTVINTKLNTLSSRIDSLVDISGTFNSKTVTSSNSDLLTASATSLALEASHIIQITTLATTSVAVINETFADGETDIGATGKFTIQVGSGTAFEVVVDATNSTLDGIAATINNLDEDVSASVIIDANGARLSLTSKTTGLDGDLTITQDGTDPVETISLRCDCRHQRHLYGELHRGRELQQYCQRCNTRSYAKPDRRFPGNRHCLEHPAGHSEGQGRNPKLRHRLQCSVLGYQQPIRG